MKISISTQRASASACAVATVLAALALQSTAVAGNHSGKREGTKTIQTQRTATGYDRHTTWAGQNGKTATRDAVVTRDRAAGTRTRDISSTGPNGKTRTVSDVTTRTETGYNRETLVTNPNGSTLMRDVTSSYDPATQTRTKEVTVDRTPPPVSDAG